MKTEITLAQAIDLHDLPQTIAAAGVSVSAGASLDIALNAGACEVFVKSYRTERDRTSERLREYGQRARVINSTHSGRDLTTAMQALNREYESDLVAEDERVRALDEQLDKRTRSFELEPINAGAISGESRYLPQIFAVLARAGLLVRGESDAEPGKKGNAEGNAK
jgi:hypothetical protein